MNNTFPLVSVVCLCYNHKEFVRESVNSVLNQSYENIEIIIVDDASTDGSKVLINEIVAEHPEIHFIDIKNNIGNCRAFNKALSLCKGEFIIDLAADDLLPSYRIAHGVEKLNKHGHDYGVHYGDVQFIDQAGNDLDKNSDRLIKRGISEKGPEGDIYTQLLGTFFLSSPSMMSRRAVFDYINGYDESLAYEDLDFWIRSSRVFKYCYTHDIMAKKRVLSTSHSTRQYKINSPQMKSTFLICIKAFELNKNKEEDEALIDRIRYEMKRSLFTVNFPLWLKYYQLKRKIKNRKTFVDNNSV